MPDGERILTCRQIYDLPELPEELIVVGSGVTGAEFASAYQALGSQVTLVSSRDRVLPHEDKDAAVVIEGVFRRRGMNVLGKSRAEAVHRKGDSVVVTLADGRHGDRLALPAHRRHGAEHGRDRLRSRRASPWTRAASSRWTGCRGRRRPACTRRATARAC